MPFGQGDIITVCAKHTIPEVADLLCNPLTYIEPIIPPKLSRGMAISAGMFAAKIKRIAGVNVDLFGPIDKLE